MCLTNPDDQTRLASSAEDRLLYCYVEPLYRKAADAGDGHAARQLAELLAVQGREEAIPLLQADADSDDEYADQLNVVLVELLAAQGRVEELGARADAGDSEAAERLAELLAVQGPGGGVEGPSRRRRPGLRQPFGRHADANGPSG